MVRDEDRSSIVTPHMTDDTRTPEEIIAQSKIDHTQFNGANIAFERLTQKQKAEYRDRFKNLYFSILDKTLDTILTGEDTNALELFFVEIKTNLSHADNMTKEHAKGIFTDGAGWIRFATIMIGKDLQTKENIKGAFQSYKDRFDKMTVVVNFDVNMEAIDALVDRLSTNEQNQSEGDDTMENKQNTNGQEAELEKDINIAEELAKKAMGVGGDAGTKSTDTSAEPKSESKSVWEAFKDMTIWEQTGVVVGAALVIGGVGYVVSKIREDSGDLVVMDESSYSL